MAKKDKEEFKKVNIRRWNVITEAELEVIKNPNSTFEDRLQVSKDMVEGRINYLRLKDKIDKNSN